MQHIPNRYGYHNQSPLIKNNCFKSLQLGRAFKHMEYIGVVNDITFFTKNNDLFKKTTNKSKLTMKRCRERERERESALFPPCDTLVVH